MLIVFPLQQLLRKRAKTLHFTYIACLVSVCLNVLFIFVVGLPPCEQWPENFRNPWTTDDRRVPRWNLSTDHLVYLSNANNATDFGSAGSRKDELPGW